MKIFKNKYAAVFLLFVIAIFFTRDSHISVAQMVSSTFDDNYQRVEKTIEVRMHKKDSVYTIQSLVIVSLSYPYLISFESLKGKAYNGNVVSFQGKALGYFTANDVIINQCTTDPERNAIGCDNVAEGDTMIRIPYFPNGKSADIYSPEGKKILTIDLSSKAVCNENETCDRPIEDSLNCPQDCKDGQPVIDAPLLTPAQQPIVPQKTFLEKVKPFVIVAAAIVALIVGIMIVFAYMRRQNKY